MLAEAKAAVVEAKPQGRLESTKARPPVTPGEQHDTTAGFVKFLLLAGQLFLLAVVIKRYNLESPAFFQLAVLAFAGFAVHHFLPLSYRLPFFVLLSLASIVLVLGPPDAAWVFAIGIVLLGICHAPFSIWVRIAALTWAAVILAGMRVGYLPSPVPVAIWPIVGSMFVFRLVVYMYDLHFKAAPISASRSLSYFFMLPNVCFPLFPVVDYQAFCRNYYDTDRYRIYLVGVRWIFRGVVHLILYRILYKNWSISLYEVANAGDLAHYCLWLFLLYLRVSGQFHIIVGMLHLFGFNLAETHHLYYLSSSFTDFWRRINIYWKDFMMKVFFYPSYFRLKQSGPVVALVVSTLLVFFMTWLLHMVQWFWLRGTFLWTTNDVLFWSILAILVVANSLWEMKRGRRRAAPGTTVSWGTALKVGLKTLATFTVICILWSLWTSESLVAWWTLWQFALMPPLVEGWLLIALAVAAIVGSAALVARYPAGFAWNNLTFMNESALRLAGMVLLIAGSTVFVRIHLGLPGRLIASAKTGDLNRMEMAELERGYYENLLDVNRFNGELWNLYSRRPPESSMSSIDAGIARRTSDFVRIELIPSVQAEYKSVVVRTNRWGMHDLEYSQKRPNGCYRIALLGDSHVMATGVDGSKDFETLVEDRLNRGNTGEIHSSYEILNFAFEGYALTVQVWMLEKKVLEFEPNAILLVGHPGDDKRVVYHLVQLVREGIEPPYPYLRDLIARAKVDKDTPDPIIRRRLTPFGEEIIAWALGRIMEISKRHSIRPIYVLVPDVTVSHDGSVECRRAEKAGFTVLNLADVYEGQSRKLLYQSAWDTHPNTRGHELLAGRLYGLIGEKQILPIGTKPAVKAVP